MTHRDGPLEGGPLSLPSDTYSFFARTSFFATGAAQYLRESRKRTKRHNRGIERAALWYTVILDEDCEKALRPEASALLLPPSTDTATRYDLQAGIRTVHSLFPFSRRERIALRREQRETGNPQFDDVTAVREAALFERWHSWLWRNEHEGAASQKEAQGDSLVLAEGCVRLSALLPRLLGYD